MSTQNLGQLLFPLQPETKKLVRQFEKCTFKIIKQKCSLIFNQTCINEHILPTYSNIKLHDEAARKENFTLDFRRKLIQREIVNPKTKIQTLEKEAT